MVSLIGSFFYIQETIEIIIKIIQILLNYKHNNNNMLIIVTEKKLKQNNVIAHVKLIL